MTDVPFSSPQSPQRLFSTDWSLPRYCCAILQTESGDLLLEQRPSTARFAQGHLTCFGGERESGESPEAAVRRELYEELRWTPVEVRPVLRLVVAGELIAWFYDISPRPAEQDVSPTAGHALVVVRRDSLFQQNLSPWHRAALAAYFDGQTVAVIPVQHS